VTVFNPLLDDPSAGQAGAVRPVGLSALDPVYKVPSIQTFSMEVQRELVAGTAVSVGYIGTRGTHLDRSRNINQPMPTGPYHFDPRLNTRAVPTEQLVPYAGFSGINMRETAAGSTYHSLQATFKRRMSRGLLFETAYTWSKAITDASGFGEQPQWSYAGQLDRGLAAFDRPHMLIVNYIYELPFFRNTREWTGKILGGWQLSGVTMYQSGTPRNLGVTGATFGLAGRPSVKPGSSMTLPKTVPQWFGTGIFEAPPFGYFGNAGRNTIRGPGIQEWDISLFKTFRLHERFSAQLRGDAFNIFNNANFDGVSTAFGAGNFGAVTSARQARVMQVSLKLEF